MNRAQVKTGKSEKGENETERELNKAIVSGREPACKC